MTHFFVAHPSHFLERITWRRKNISNLTWLSTKCYYVADPNKVFNNIFHFKNLCVNVSFIKLNWDLFVEF